MDAPKHKQGASTQHIYVAVELPVPSGHADRPATCQQKEEISELQLSHATAQKKQNQKTSLR